MSSRHIKYEANKLNEKDKIDLIQQMHEEGLHSNEFGHMHGISGSTIRKWERKLKFLQETGVDTFHKVGGQALIDEESMKNLAQECDALYQKENSPNRGQLEEMILEKMNETSLKMGKDELHDEIKKTTYYNIKMRAGIHKNKGQTKTLARIRAEADPRNALSMAILLETFAKDLDSDLVCNFDSTSCCIFPEDGPLYFRRKESDLPVTNTKDSELPVILKFMFFHNAAGKMAPIVIIIDDPNLDPEQIVFTRFRWNSTHFPGYLCFMKSRSLTNEFQHFFFEYVVYPFIDEMQANVARRVIFNLFLFENYLISLFCLRFPKINPFIL